MAILVIIYSALASVLGAFYLYRKFYCHRFFVRLGLPGPEPHWLYGNLHQLWKEPGKRHLLLQSWAKQYGSFYGYYEGATPVLVATTLEGAEQILVKQYSNFQGHRAMPIQPDPNTDAGSQSVFAVDMFFAWNQEWKRLRNHISPGFSIAKMKSSMPLVNKSMKQLLKIFDAKSKTREDFNVLEYWQRFTFDVIGALSFGIDLNSIEGGETGARSEAIDIIRGSLSLLTEKPAISRFVMAVPELRRILKACLNIQATYLGMGPMKYWTMSKNLAMGVIKQRVENPSSRRQDILQSMIDVSDLADNPKAVEKPLDVHEITSHCRTIMIAGMETTSTTLGFMSYLLPNHPEVQQKLFDEIYDAFPDTEELLRGEDSLYDKLFALPYLDMVIKETARLYPIIFEGLSRFIMADSNVCGIDIPKSAAVFVDMYSIMHDATLWGPVDPEKFYPERFSKEYSTGRPDNAFMPFGIGPRTCVGMRLAYLELKVALATIVRLYKICPPKQGYPKEGLPLKSDGLLCPRSGVFISFEPR